ncbi:unnamed protein product, partial [Discosporangium mesarthrocarpum]
MGLLHNCCNCQKLFSDIGEECVDHVIKGYNTTIFAYGQTGSGKSYSMMGTGNTMDQSSHVSEEDHGIIPRLCSRLFQMVYPNPNPNPNPNLTLFYLMEVSYMEIYNENVRDLFHP